MGKLAGWQGSTTLSRWMVKTFARHYQIDLGEAAKPLEAYQNLQQFFTRKLKPGARPIDPAPDSVVSPVDGRIAAHGAIDDLWCTQIKGKRYRVDELLAQHPNADLFRGGSYLTIYLSPRNYHRIHSPVSGRITAYHHIPGQLYPVNAAAVRYIDRLFAINERVISYIHTERDYCLALVKVGAIGVGNITLDYADIQTNQPMPRPVNQRLNPPIPIEKGAELAVFNLGSTVVLLFPAGAVQLNPFSPGQEVRMGEKIAVNTQPLQEEDP